MSIWQTGQWNKMLEKNKQVAKILKQGEIYIQKRSIGLGQFGLFIMGIAPDTTIDSVTLQNICKKEKCLFIQIEFLSYDGAISDKKIVLFEEGHYKKFITPYTAIIDLQKSEDEILAGMKPKGRYNIKLAQKKGVVVEKVEKTDQNIQKYYELSTETTSRDNFIGHGLEYYKTFLQELQSSELYLASVDGVVIAGGIFVFEAHSSYYYYGASTSDIQYRNLMAPYLVQWSAIKQAQALGSQYYDFLGISGEGKDEDLSLKGVTDFKKKFTKYLPKVSSAIIYKHNPLLLKELMCLKDIRKKFSR